jgi:hypothetical protein
MAFCETERLGCLVGEKPPNRSSHCDLNKAQRALISANIARIGPSRSGRFKPK